MRAGGGGPGVGAEFGAIMTIFSHPAVFKLESVLILSVCVCEC